MARHDPADLPEGESGAPLTVAVTGASGMVGSALVSSLTSDGHGVLRLVRRQARQKGEIAWDPMGGVSDPASLESCDALVALHGANIAGGRWTSRRRRLLVSSRVKALEALAASLADLEAGPGLLISASGVGIYGPRPLGEIDEQAPRGEGFLADLAADWEEAARGLAVSLGARVAFLRFGVILSPRGGALSKLLPVYRLGLGGVVAGGRRMMSWVALDDAVAAIRHLLSRRLEGAFNVVAPAAVSQRQFTEVLGRVLARPTPLPVPARVLRILLGTMAEETLLADQSVKPSRLLESGFRFRFPSLEPALRHLLG